VSYAAAKVRRCIATHADEVQTSLLPFLLRDDMRQPVFEAIDELEFPELYDETIPVLSFFRYLRKLMGAAGYHDLSMRVSDSEHDSALAYRACNTAMLRERQGTGVGKPHSLRPCRVA
jgi:Nuf2 family